MKNRNRSWIFQRNKNENMEEKIMSTENNERMSLAAPWTTYVSELEAMFAGDLDISIVYDECAHEVKLYVNGEKKADALTKILNSEVTFGNVTLKITVIPANCKNEEDILDCFRDAFEGNPAMTRVIPVTSPLGTHRFVMFRNKVVQFYNDQLDDPYGNKYTLYQEIAKDIFNRNFAVNFCTEPGEDAIEEIEEDDLSNG